MPSPRQSLREKLQRGETIVAPGAYDPISARVVQSLGFPAVYTGGYVTGAHTAITEPLLTLTDQVEVARKVAQAVPEVPLLVIAGADDISVQEYADLGYQIIIYATTPIVVAVNALLEAYQHLHHTGLLNLTAQQVADIRTRVEALIDLPAFYQIEAETTERQRAGNHG